VGRRRRLQVQLAEVFFDFDAGLELADLEGAVSQVASPMAPMSIWGVPVAFRTSSPISFGSLTCKMRGTSAYCPVTSKRTPTAWLSG